MAENAANISSIQHNKPNLLELVAQDSFMDSVYPAFKALCSYVAIKSRTHFNWLDKWYDEVFLGTNFLLQYYYLKVFSASFSEAFYRLKRIPLSSQKKKRLSHGVIISSLFFLVIVPYINRKVQTISREHEEIMLTSNKKRKIINIDSFRKTVGIVYGSAKLYFLISYLAGSSKVHDPFLKLSGVELVYQDRQLPSWRDMLQAVFLNKSDSSKMRVYFFFKLMAASLEIGAFFVQFLNWWHSDESRNILKLPLPKPPHMSSGMDTCPICHSKRKNEVVLYTSGYMFCYLCIKDFLNKNGKCPVTNLPSSIDNVVRIYSNC